MIEKVVQFGSRKSLTGLLCKPESASAEVGVLFLNSGILHSVGASRLPVLIARDLVSHGIASFRFDQSTIGDSGPRYEGGGYLESAIDEAMLAIAEIKKRTNVKKVIVFGLCSGSDVGFEAALQSEDICGLIQLDPYAYRTIRYHLTYYRPRLRCLSSWKNFFTRVLSRKVTSSIEDLQETWFEKPEYVRVFPPKKEVAEKYQALVKRGVSFLAVFSGGQVYAYNYCGQLRDALRGVAFADSLTEEFYPHSSHIFTDVVDQRLLRTSVQNWCLGFLAREIVDEVPLGTGTVKVPENVLVPLLAGTVDVDLGLHVLVAKAFCALQSHVVGFRKHI